MNKPRCHFGLLRALAVAGAVLQFAPLAHAEGHWHCYGHGGGGSGGGFFMTGFVPIGFYAPVAPIVVQGNQGGGMWLPTPKPPFTPRGNVAPANTPRPAKADGLVTIGDRLFRAKNTKKAQERYDQARKANPTSATPLVRLAQLEIGRGEYRKAADLIRDAMNTEPGWHVNATDIQSIYAEPSDFAKMIARIESHLQQSPNDRDAWLVLGTQLYLSGKTRQAGDVFRRINDRKPDATLAAFLDATDPSVPARQ